MLRSSIRLTTVLFHAMTRERASHRVFVALDGVTG